MKRIIPVLLALFLIPGCGIQPTGTSYRQISTEEAAAMMEEESNYIILDVRTEEEYNDKHIANAINIPNEAIGKEEIPELQDKEQLILVHLHHIFTKHQQKHQNQEKVLKLQY